MAECCHIIILCTRNIIIYYIIITYTYNVIGFCFVRVTIRRDESFFFLFIDFNYYLSIRKR